VTEINPHLQRDPVLAGAELARARRAALLVHGRDQDEAVTLDVVARLELPDVAYVLPVAAGRSWYPGRYFDPVAGNEPYVGWALEALQAGLDVIAAAGIADEQVVVAGFSQGACLVAELVALAARRWAGAALLTGSLLGPDGDMTTPRDVDGLAMFISSSRIDAWIAPERAVATAHAFEAAGAAVTLALDDDPEHHINDAAVAGLRALLTR
jgi:phospholipase/carboxylesterase